ncbi:MAG: DUF3299 domain-containing protein [Chromatiaceae bacterium]|nr:MAG: DUF3299 domain-containing protein [Chromatiaceae bacterium]
MTPPALLRLLPVLSLALLLAGCGDQPPPADPAIDADDAPAFEPEPLPPLPEDPNVLVELQWDYLIPPGWRPDQLLDDYDVDAIDDDDPRADELMQKLLAIWAEAPVVEVLDGRRVRLPGFVVPLELDATEIAEFLLVPYFGACIHVPPPPANQTVLVRTVADVPYRGGLFDVVWVEGRMRVESFANELGDAGYRIEEAAVSPYEEPL